jgi:hypothetical protein
VAAVGSAPVDAFASSVKRYSVKTGRLADITG